MTSMIPEYLSFVTSSLEFLRNRKNDTAQERRHRREAVGQVMHAVIATKAYLYNSNQGEPTARDQELEISRCWQRAATAIGEYDQALSQTAELKSLGWADPREWKRAEAHAWAIRLDVIIDQCHWLQEND
jgi:hypothetical protein